mmetsp:Transcript_22832/g.37598  ORF Transcript_22832/g.37598 Transcript_22832/m.37598 type:complete len:121 (+) Transcript_22832:565-927(+)
MALWASQWPNCKHHYFLQDELPMSVHPFLHWCHTIRQDYPPLIPQYCRVIIVGSTNLTTNPLFKQSQQLSCLPCNCIRGMGTELQDYFVVVESAEVCQEKKVFDEDIHQQTRSCLYWEVV